jgi:hypothetical protein
MRTQKMREEAAEKERDKYFNISRSVIPMKQEWKVKEKVDTLHSQPPMMTWTCWTTMRLHH